MQEVNFLAKYQKATKRDYVARVVEHDKAECATVAKKWGADYWDGPRQYGYGGYKYDGRWLAIAQDIAKHYGLKAGDRVLDVGCGKAFLLYELTQGLQVAGLDISEYGIEHAKEEVRPLIKQGHCKALPFDSNSFDFVFSINTFHNLEIFDLEAAVTEVERVGKSQKKWICVESFRNESEKANMLYWQLTCMSFYSPDAWAYIYKKCGYTGDYGFIFFE
jgi:protein-L-isoaspartate(D-aspartate) O-methyltransferase